MNDHLDEMVRSKVLVPMPGTSTIVASRAALSTVLDAALLAEATAALEAAVPTVDWTPRRVKLAVVDYVVARLTR